jgi:hypothetical protein
VPHVCSDALDHFSQSGAIFGYASKACHGLRKRGLRCLEVPIRLRDSIERQSEQAVLELGEVLVDSARLAPTGE